MDEKIDLKKVARQHVEMDMFFVGDFALANGLAGVPDEGGAGDDAGTAAAEGLAAIAAEVGACCKCGLGETRTNAVPGEGNPNAKIVFVGEAPGADEDAQGRPFVGRAGQLLEKIINAMGQLCSYCFYQSLWERMFLHRKNQKNSQNMAGKKRWLVGST